MMDLEVAWNKVCTNAQHASRRWLTLYQRIPFYGGPEEGGWWGEDVVMMQYQSFPSEVEANKAMALVEEELEVMNREAQREYGLRCIQELDWLEDRGLPESVLGEPDGPASYFMMVEETLGSCESRGERFYS